MFGSLLRAVAACMFVLAGAAIAQVPPDQNRELTLASAIDLALTRNLDLAASRYELTAAQGRLTQAGLRLNPELAVELENFAGTDDVGGIDALEATLSLSQVIELGDKRALRVGAAESDRDLIILEQRARELDVLAEVARRFVEVVAAQERLRYSQEAANLAQQTLDAITQRVQAARSPVAEQSRARIALTRAMLEQQQAGSQLRSARYSLVALWGDAEPSFSAASADLFRTESDQPFEAFFDRLERSPEFLAFTSAARLRDAELRLARAQARPNVAVALGLRQLQQTNDVALVAGFAMPLMIRNRNQGAILEAQARRAQTDAERRAALAGVRATLLSLYQEMTTARARSEVLRRDALPQAEIALQQTQAGYDVGRFSFLELVTAQQELLELRGTAINAAADYHLFRAELERLTSEPLTTALEAPQP